MPVNSEFHVAVMPGDGIGAEIMPPCVELLERLARDLGGFSFRFETLEAGAAHYQRSGTALPEEVLARQTAQDFDAGRHNLGANTVAGQDRDVKFGIHGHGWATYCF